MHMNIYCYCVTLYSYSLQYIFIFDDVEIKKKFIISYKFGFCSHFLFYWNKIIHFIYQHHRLCHLFYWALIQLIQVVNANASY